ncbi:cytochrome protein [Xylariaceae sp. FL0016]|nr:cytochrome protein [Xylariaceae sp. FL0016]
MSTTRELLLSKDAVLLLFAIAIGGLIAYALASTIHDLFFSPLRNVPGPPLARFTRLWEFAIVRRGYFFRDLIALHEKYGPVVRLAPNRFSFNRTEEMKKIYDLHNPFLKSDFYKAFGDPRIDNQLNIQDAKEHARRKRAMASLYSMSTMVNYEGLVDKSNTVFVDKLGELADNRVQVPMYDFCQYYAFDVIGQITWDEDFGMTKDGRDKSGVLHFIERIDQLGATAGLFPEIIGLVFGMINTFSKVAGNVLSDYIGNVVAKSKALGPQAKVNPRAQSFATKLMGLEAEGKLIKPMTRYPGTFFDVMGGNIIAGSETTGISLSATFWYLYTHPDKLAKLRHEINGGIAAGRWTECPTFAQTQEMPYLQAVIKEVLRLHPAVGVILPRVVPDTGANLGGYFFPKGTVVGCSGWALHYNKDKVERPDEFLPERWLSPDGAIPVGNITDSFSVSCRYSRILHCEISSPLLGDWSFPF